MDSSPQHENFNVLFVGAGNIMFGSPEGPWNHSIRLEQKLGLRLKVVAVIDPATDRAASALSMKRDSESVVVSAYQDTQVFRTFQEFMEQMTSENRPRAVIIGSPPMFRGSTSAGRDIELQLVKALPGVALFIEKPIATGAEDEINQGFEISKAIASAGTVCSVGYMLRYLKAVETMKRIIDSNNLTVMATIARYATAYESIAKPDWWDKSKSAGPIIEQGTHFCDLSRYFGGEVDISSVQAHSLEWYESSGKLSKIPIDEDKILPENRISRVTAATWKYDSGAVGTLTHVVALQGRDYSCEFEVYADGYSLKLVNPYVLPLLYIRKPGDDTESCIKFDDDDPFFTEISNFISSVEGDDVSTKPLSSYEDAVRSYQFSWAIRRAAENSAKSK